MARERSRQERSAGIDLRNQGAMHGPLVPTLNYQGISTASSLTDKGTHVNFV
jgi:hypothetical protein